IYSCPLCEGQDRVLPCVMSVPVLWSVSPAFLETRCARPDTAHAAVLLPAGIHRFDPRAWGHLRLFLSLLAGAKCGIHGGAASVMVARSVHGCAAARQQPDRDVLSPQLDRRAAFAAGWHSGEYPAARGMGDGGNLPAGAANARR